MLRQLRQKGDRTEAEEETLRYIDRKHLGLIRGLKINPWYFAGTYGLTLALTYHYAVALLYDLPEWVKECRLLLRVIGTM